MFNFENYEELIRKGKGLIPSVDRILKETLQRLNLKPPQIERDFSNCLISVDQTATEIYRNYERKALIRLAEDWVEIQKDPIQKSLMNLLRKNDWEKFKKEASKIFTEFGVIVQRLEKDLGNTRKARGGKTFEKAIAELLRKINIPVEKPEKRHQKELKRIDLVIPSVEVAMRTPDRAYFLTCKRTLRERWKQEVPDTNLPESKAMEIDEKGLIAFVRDELKNELKDKDWIRSLNSLPQEIRR